MKYMSDGTVTGTVLWPVQFSGWNAIDDSPKYRERIECAKIMEDDPIVLECLKAWHEAENGSNTTGRATLYYNPSISNPPWAKTCIETAVIGKHRYMREG